MKQSIREVVNILANYWLEGYEDTVLDELSGSTTDGGLWGLASCEWAAATAGVMRELTRRGYHAEGSRLAAELIAMAEGAV